MPSTPGSQRVNASLIGLNSSICFYYLTLPELITLTPSAQMLNLSLFRRFYFREI